jgi:hypothetical protein
MADAAIFHAVMALALSTAVATAVCDRSIATDRITDIGRVVLVCGGSCGSTHARAE